MGTSSYATFRDAQREWQPLLEALAPSSSLAVGTAIHWVRSHGYFPNQQQSNDKVDCSVEARLWRLIPELLAFQCVISIPSQENQERAASNSNRVAIGNCMWMQTLPAVMQINILNFLSAEHIHFHAKDLEILSCNLLSGSEDNFWLKSAAYNLLLTVKEKAASVQTEEREHVLKKAVAGNEPPDWFQNYEGYRRVLPWLQVASLARTKPDIDSDFKSHKVEKMRTGESLYKEATGLRNASASSDVQRDFQANILASSFCNDEVVKQIADDLEGDAGVILGQTLRESLLKNEPILEGMRSLRQSSGPCAILKLIKPWEMRDDVMLGMLEIGLREEDGFLWSAQLLSYCLLPKLLSLEQPASRFLFKATLQAAELHPRALVDAVLVPVVLCSQGGPNTIQCDVLNRTMKENLPAHHIVSFLGKIVLQSRREHLPFVFPSSVVQDYLGTTLLWTEPICSLLQGILSQSISLDEELVSGLVLACEEALPHLKKSLKFSNLLLCLLSRYGLLLKQHKSSLQRVSEGTETFMTKSLISKASSL